MVLVKNFNNWGMIGEVGLWEAVSILGGGPGFGGSLGLGGYLSRGATPLSSKFP